MIHSASVCFLKHSYCYLLHSFVVFLFFNKAKNELKNTVNYCSWPLHRYLTDWFKKRAEVCSLLPCVLAYGRWQDLCTSAYCSNWRSRTRVQEIHDVKNKFFLLWRYEGHFSQYWFHLKFDFLVFFGRKSPTTTSFHFICFQRLPLAAPSSPLALARLIETQRGNVRVRRLSSSLSFLQKDSPPGFLI